MLNKLLSALADLSGGHANSLKHAVVPAIVSTMMAFQATANDNLPKQSPLLTVQPNYGLVREFQGNAHMGQKESCKTMPSFLQP